MEYKVYILKSLVAISKFYSGMTADLDRRLGEHNSGKCQSTSAHSPWIIFHTETFPDRAKARAREKYFKSGAGRKFIKILENSRI
jgi:predicted GIY-YIG superfamily endonuclease